jgi:hypothetical protein
MPAKRRSSSTLVGEGRLFIGDHPACLVVYHLVCWGGRARPDRMHVSGALRRPDGRGFTEFIGRDDVALFLPGENLWWNCTVVTPDGWATTREGGLHRRPR